MLSSFALIRRYGEIPTSYISSFERRAGAERERERSRADDNGTHSFEHSTPANLVVHSCGVVTGLGLDWYSPCRLASCEPT